MNHKDILEAVLKFDKNEEQLTFYEYNVLTCFLHNCVAFIPLMEDRLSHLPVKHIDDIDNINADTINLENVIVFANKMALARKEQNIIDIEDKLNQLNGKLL